MLNLISIAQDTNSHDCFLFVSALNQPSHLKAMRRNGEVCLAVRLTISIRYHNWWSKVAYHPTKKPHHSCFSLAVFGVSSNQTSLQKFATNPPTRAVAPPGIPNYITVIVVIKICAHTHFDVNDMYNKAETGSCPWRILLSVANDCCRKILWAARERAWPMEKSAGKGVQSPMSCDACEKRFLYMALVCRPAVTRAGKGLQSRPAKWRAGCKW